MCIALQPSPRHSLEMKSLFEGSEGGRAEAIKRCQAFGTLFAKIKETTFLGACLVSLLEEVFRNLKWVSFLLLFNKCNLRQETEKCC